MSLRLLMLLCCGLSAAAQAQNQSAPDHPPLEAVTAGGDKVLLHPNGRWEFVDAKKAEVAKKVAEQYPENKLVPEGAQGGLFGVGRKILPGDKDYNRGSLSPKTR